jgi:PAS domain S-box-containing protein
MEEVEREILAQGYWHGELTHTRADGTTIVVTSRQVLQRDEAGKPVAILEINRDITKRKQAEKQAETVGRLYRFLSRVNEAIVRAAEPKTLFQEACRIAVEDGRFILAWVGMVDREAGLLKLVAQYGLEGYLDNNLMSIRDVPEGQGPGGVSIREERTDICQDFGTEPRMAPWREKADAHGIRSSASLPLRQGGEVVGAIGFYADQSEFFSADKITLLEALAEDLSFAMESMDREVKRRAAEEEIRRMSAYTRSLIEVHLDPLVTISPTGKITDINRATEEATGISRDRLIGSDFSEYFVEPEKARQGYQQVLSLGFVRDYPLELRHASGRIMDVLYNAAVYRNAAGAVEGVFAAARDVTDRKRAEEAVKAERQRLYDVLETLPAMVCLLTPDYHVTFANRSSENGSVGLTVGTVMNIVLAAVSHAISAKVIKCSKPVGLTVGKSKGRMEV